MDLDDSLSLSMYELEKGIAIFTRSGELFDCYPAVRTAFKFTKKLHMAGEDYEELAEETENYDSIEENSGIPLFYSEYQEFLAALHQYYVYCKVNLYIYLLSTVLILLLRCLIMLRLMKKLLCLGTCCAIQKL